MIIRQEYAMKNITVSDILIATGGTLIRGNASDRVDDISIDSKAIPSDRTLFIPLIGEKADGHRYIGNALENGAYGCIISAAEAYKSAAAAVTVIRVADTKKALQDIGAYYRRTRNITLIGVTGSVGKTTTREMIATALLPAGSANIYQTTGNRNSQTGVPLTLADIADERLGVIELGMSEEGEIERLAKMAMLDVAVVTNIGVAHIRQLKTQDNICREKLSITKGLKENGCILINGDDAFMRKYRDRISSHKLYMYGTGDDCDFRISDIEQAENGMKFVLTVPGEFAGKTQARCKCSVSIPVMGIHNVSDAAAAIGAACVAGIDAQAAASAMAGFAGVKMRQQIYTKNNITIIDDSYNANPDSMKAGLHVLADYKNHANGRKIALLADMKELGDGEVSYHEKIGRIAAELPIDVVLGVGELAKHICNACADAQKVSGVKIKVRHFDGNIQASDFLRSELKKGDILFVKGSRSMALDEVIRLL